MTVGSLLKLITVVLLCPHAAWAALPRYSVIDLGQGVQATALNARGQVVGDINVQGVMHAFITGEHGGGLTDLGTFNGLSSHALAVNAQGQVAGWWRPEGPPRSNLQSAFVTGDNGQGMRDLGTLGSDWFGTGQVAFATGINDSGVVVGQGFVTPGIAQVLIAAPGAAMHAFGVGDASTYGAVVNASGQIAGSYNVGGDYFMFLTGPDAAGPVRLDDGNSLRQAQVAGINDAGQVVGGYHFDGGWARLAFVTGPNGFGLQRLAGLPGDTSAALDINNLGQIVGEENFGSGLLMAFVTEPGSLAAVDLNGLALLPPGVHLDAAVAVNDAGQIAVNSGNGHAYLLTPVPEPATTTMLLSGLLVLAAGARRGSGPAGTLGCRGKQQ